eukprot:2814573-Heterocapsa_arctica.AAC.1
MNVKWGRRLPAHAEDQPWVQYLGKQWKRTDNGFLLRTAPNYIDEIAQLLRLQNAKAAPTPCVATVKATSDAGRQDSQLNEEMHHVFR